MKVIIKTVDVIDSWNPRLSVSLDIKVDGKLFSCDFYNKSIYMIGGGSIDKKFNEKLGRDATKQEKEQILNTIINDDRVIQKSLDIISLVNKKVDGRINDVINRKLVSMDVEFTRMYANDRDVVAYYIYDDTQSKVSYSHDLINNKPETVFNVLMDIIAKDNDLYKQFIHYSLNSYETFYSMLRKFVATNQFNTTIDNTIHGKNLFSDRYVPGSIGEVSYATYKNNIINNAINAKIKTISLMFLPIKQLSDCDALITYAYNGLIYPSKYSIYGFFNSIYSVFNDLTNYATKDLPIGKERTIVYDEYTYSSFLFVIKEFLTSYEFRLYANIMHNSTLPKKKIEQLLKLHMISK